MILTITKYHKNLLRDSPLPSLSIVKFLSSLETKMILKIPNETFLRITRYNYNNSITQENERISSLYSVRLVQSDSNAPNIRSFFYKVTVTTKQEETWSSFLILGLQWRD